MPYRLDLRREVAVDAFLGFERLLAGPTVASTTRGIPSR